MVYKMILVYILLQFHKAYKFHIFVFFCKVLLFCKHHIEECKNKIV